MWNKTENILQIWLNLNKYVIEKLDNLFDKSRSCEAHVHFLYF